MEINNSPLLFKEFFVLGSSLIAVPLEDEPEEIINDYPIDIDFDIYEAEEKTNEFKILITINGNNEEDPTPGYCFGFVAEGYFGFNSDSISKKEDIDIFLTRSALPMMIGQIRSIITSLTSLGPFGKYILPSIDMNDLLNKKGEDDPNDQEGE